MFDLEFHFSEQVYDLRHLLLFSLIINLLKSQFTSKAFEIVLCCFTKQTAQMSPFILGQTGGQESILITLRSLFGLLKMVVGGVTLRPLGPYPTKPTARHSTIYT